MHTRSSKSLLTVLALLAGLAAGCVFSTGDGDLDGDTGDDGNGECPGANIHEFAGECYCDIGYEWADPGDPENLDCVEEMMKEGECDEPGNVEMNGICYCDDNLSWCSSDPNDFSCCEDPGHNDAGTDDSADDVADTGDTGIDTGADTGPDDTGPDPDTGVEPDPLDCTEDGLNFCSNTEEQGPEGSRTWVCMGGEWVEDSTVGDQSCMFDGFDFAYGCVSTSDTVQFVCGDGPGTPCDGDAASCNDTDIISYCLYGKLSEDSCFRICTEDGDDMMVTYEHGQCDAEAMECFCCDEGDEGCNIGG
jgi:hypothetical protein